MARILGGIGFTDPEEPDPLEPGALLAGELTGQAHPRSPNARDAASGVVQNGDDAMAADSILLASGLKVGDRLPLRIQCVPRNRAGRFSKQLERRRGWVWSSQAPVDVSVVTASALMVGSSSMVASGTAVPPVDELGQMAAVADAVATFRGGYTPGGVSAAMVANAVLFGLANIKAAGVCLMQADSVFTAQATGGSAGPSANDRRSGIVSIGIRGGHS